MYDKYSERQFVNIGNETLISTRFEIWSNGQLIESQKVRSIITFETITTKSPSENSILVAINSAVDQKYLAKNFSFDVAYTNGDRILLGIIANQSNYHTTNTYAVFVGSAPFYTRPFKEFAFNEPFAGSIYLINDYPAKITFSTLGTKCLIEFYSD